MRAVIDQGDTFRGNSGDSALDTPSRIFKAIQPESGWVSTGLNRDLGTGFPVPLNSANATVNSNDLTYPIIARDKRYGALAHGRVGLPTNTYPNFNIIPYPQINFGYSRPGEPFVAKRNWWAFRVDVASHDHSITRLARFQREFVLSIYEIPSQLPISAGAFMSLGEFASGEAWGNVNIEGNIFAGRAEVRSETDLPSLASRRGLDLGNSATIDGRTFNNPFAPGVREQYLLTEGDFFPVSLASESGKAAFIPINRGADYFDRFSHSAESTTLSPTSWNQYSVGALQCAMTLDITQAVSTSNNNPTSLRFTYLRSGIRQTLNLPLDQGLQSGLPPGYILAVGENHSYHFPTPVDVAYGHGSQFYFKENISGTITFNNATFGDPLVGTYKYGYYRPQMPFEIKSLAEGKICVAVYPERLPAFLAILGADSPAINHSLAVNVDYPGSSTLTKPNIPCTENDYGVILRECANLTAFTRGFSLVTNLRLYFGDDFNIVPTSPPAGFSPPGQFFPPSSIFAPEKRYGVDFDPYAINMSGQIGSVASDSIDSPIRPLDSVGASGSALMANRINVNLSKISHPAELPPVFMMNWLVVLEERRKEFFAGN